MPDRIIICMFLIFMCVSALAHDAQRPELNKWFDGLKSGSGAPCCSNADGNVVIDGDWESNDGHYRVRIPINGTTDMEWVDVPDEAVIKEPNRDGRTIVWPLRGYLGTTIRCFMPGPGT